MAGETWLHLVAPEVAPEAHAVEDAMPTVWPQTAVTRLGSATPAKAACCSSTTPFRRANRLRHERGPSKAQGQRWTEAAMPLSHRRCSARVAIVTRHPRHNPYSTTICTRFQTRHTHLGVMGRAFAERPILFGL